MAWEAVTAGLQRRPCLGAVARGQWPWSSLPVPRQQLSSTEVLGHLQLLCGSHQSLRAMLEIKTRIFRRVLGMEPRDSSTLRGALPSNYTQTPNWEILKHEKKFTHTHSTLPK